MVLHKKQLFRKVRVRGHNGGALLEFLPAVVEKASPSILPLASKIVSNIISKIGFNNIAKSLGGLAVGSLATYGVNKLLNKNEETKQQPVYNIPKIPHEPTLTVGPKPQGLIKGDILPVTSEIEYISPENHEIHLPDGYRKNTGTNVIRKQRVAGQGLKKYPKKGGNISKILNKKSQDILNSIIGSGLYKL